MARFPTEFYFLTEIKDTPHVPLSVAGFISIINDTVGVLGDIEVQGELSDVRLSNGMMFFDLKDSGGNDAVVKCFMHRWVVQYYTHLLEAGMEVIVRGKPSMYKSGYFRIVVNTVEPVGVGALQKAFDALKKKLADKGYFDSHRKRPLPPYIQKIGLMTSSYGAVIHDFKKNLAPCGFDVSLLDVRVEGADAEESLCSAIRWFNTKCPDRDILVLIRGGGGLENLKAFNSERLAEAIITSRIPIVVGIGHEQDQTIADFVADKSFSTPTAVAAHFSHMRHDTSEHIARIIQQLEMTAQECLRTGHEKMRTSVHDLDQELTRLFDGVKEIERKFLYGIHEYDLQTQEKKQAIARQAEEYARLLSQSLESYTTAVSHAESQLRVLNPAAILKRGYSIVRSKNRAILDTTRINPGDSITIQLSAGSLDATIDSIHSP